MIRVRYTQKNVTQWIKTSLKLHFFPKVSFIVQLRKRLKWSTHEMVSQLVFSLKESWIHKICLALIKINGYFDIFLFILILTQKSKLSATLVKKIAYDLYALVLLQKLCKNCPHPEKLHSRNHQMWRSKPSKNSREMAGM